MNDRDQRSRDLGNFAVRIVLGSCFVLHGLQKVTGAFGGMGMSKFVRYVDGYGVTAPTMTAYAVAFGELLAGAALLVGFCHRTAAVVITVIMVGAILYATGTEGYFLAKGYEYNLALMAMAFAVFMGGPGAYAYRMQLKRNQL